MPPMAAPAQQEFNGIKGRGSIRLSKSLFREFI